MVVLKEYPGREEEGVVHLANMVLVTPASTFFCTDSHCPTLVRQIQVYCSSKWCMLQMYSRVLLRNRYRLFKSYDFAL